MSFEQNYPESQLRNLVLLKLILYLILIIDGIDIYLPFQIKEPHLSIS